VYWLTCLVSKSTLAFLLLYIYLSLFCFWLARTSCSLLGPFCSLFEGAFSEAFSEVMLLSHIWSFHIFFHSQSLCLQSSLALFSYLNTFFITSISVQQQNFVVVPHEEIFAICRLLNPTKPVCNGVLALATRCTTFFSISARSTELQFERLRHCLWQVPRRLGHPDWRRFVYHLFRHSLLAWLEALFTWYKFLDSVLRGNSKSIL